MPRQARLDIPGVLQHVSAKGFKSTDIFYTDEDRIDFMQRLESILFETQTKCYAWSLMPDHFHILIRPEKYSLKKIMRRLMIGYAVSFNQRNNHKGAIFKDRYRSIVCQDDLYLLELIRYIHLKPIRSGLVQNISELENYMWSGHAYISGVKEYSFFNEHCNQNIKKFFINNLNDVYANFSDDVINAKKQYKKFVEQGLHCENSTDLQGGGWIRSSGKKRKDIKKDTDFYDERILGSSEFVKQVLESEKKSKKVDVKYDYKIHDLITKITNYYGVDIDELLRKSQKKIVSKARSVICYIEIYKMKKPGSIVGKMMRIKPYSAIRCAERGKTIFENDFDLKQILDKK